MGRYIEFLNRNFFGVRNRIIWRPIILEFFLYPSKILYHLVHVFQLLLLVFIGWLIKQISVSIIQFFRDFLLYWFLFLFFVNMGYERLRLPKFVIIIVLLGSLFILCVFLRWRYIGKLGNQFFLFQFLDFCDLSFKRFFIIFYNFLEFEIPSYTLL